MILKEEAKTKKNLKSKSRIGRCQTIVNGYKFRNFVDLHRLFILPLLTNAL